MNSIFVYEMERVKKPLNAKDKINKFCEKNNNITMKTR